ncbi:uncharacterized protein LOC101769101 isoform X1 [Setaria italica]|uniref:uncharacterized protein LOC101769101 isoform X1 n=1 Tax=Setaria italica TaxID=4555 RepID=UPI00035096FE|nr:uncharacterized protein LOC101769101 isoform X1 [Setaria italica]
MSWRKGGGADCVARSWVLLLCVGSFCLGLLFTNREASTKLFLIAVELASCRTLGKTIANLETELSAARTLQDYFGKRIMDDGVMLQLPVDLIDKILSHITNPASLACFNLQVLA